MPFSLKLNDQLFCTLRQTLALNFRFTLTNCLTFVLVVALAMGLLRSQHQRKRQVEALRATIADTRSTLHTIEYGAANLRLLELNPTIWQDSECSRFLKHELALSILEHWRERDAIDKAIEKRGYSLNFARNALVHFDCRSASEFFQLARNELWVYPDDNLLLEEFEMSESEMESFDAFLRMATMQPSR